MADIQFVRPPRDNKIRNFTPLPRTTETLRILPAMNQDGGTAVASWELFVTSEPKAKVIQTAPPPSPKIPRSTKNKDSLGVSGCKKKGPLDRKTEDSDILFHPTGRSPSLPGITCNDVDDESTTATERSSSFGTISSKHRSSERRESSSPKQVIRTDDKKSKNGDRSSSNSLNKANSSPTRSDVTGLPSTDLSMFNVANCKAESDSENSSKKCAVANLDTPSNWNNRSNRNDVMIDAVTSGSTRDSMDSLVDVREDEVDQLPDVSKPTGVFSPADKQFASRECKTNIDVGECPAKWTQGKEAATKSVNSHRTPVSVFKRSVSSFSFVEPEYRSFFGSLRKHDFPEEETEEEDHYYTDVPINPLWNLRRPWVFSDSFQRTQSAGSLMQSAKRQKQSRHALKNVLRNIEDEDDDEMDAASDDGDDCMSVCVGSVGNVDRLTMRRGALAQPERMIMSQAVREKVQRDVEKRKTSMVRRVSQFLNVQLGLNREEDLI